MRLALPYYWTLRTVVGRSPRLFDPLYRAFNESPTRLVSRDTEIVIEGFPRSGNSFSVNAFTWAQARAVSIANHIHTPGQVTAGLRLGKPVCVLIRNPRDAIPALLAKIPHFSPSDACAAYNVYYRSLLPLRSDVVIAPFEDVTSDFGAVISRLNEKFSMNFNTIDLEVHRAYSQQYLALEKLQQTAETSNRIAYPGFGWRKTDPKKYAGTLDYGASESIYQAFKSTL